MNFIELVMISLGLSTDAFVGAVNAGLKMDKIEVKKALIIGLYFGLFQAGMPVLGYILAIQFSENVGAFSPWIAFVVLSFLGGKTIMGVFKKDSKTGNSNSNEEVSVSPKKCCHLLLLQALMRLRLE